MNGISGLIKRDQGASSRFQLYEDTKRSRKSAIHKRLSPGPEHVGTLISHFQLQNCEK